MLTRRSLIRSSASLLGAMSVRSGAVQHVEGVSLERNLGGGVLDAVSPDGKKLAIYNAWQTRVLEIGTWKVLFHARYRAWTSFFSGSDSLFLAQMRFQTRQLVVADLRSGKVSEHTQTSSVHSDHFTYAAGDGVLLMTDFGDFLGTRTISLLALPDYRVTKQVPFETQPRNAKSLWDTILYFSADRKTAVYVCDDIVVCRRTSDLEVLWTQRSACLPQSLVLMVSADGSVVAVTGSEEPRPSFWEPYPRCYTIIYDGKTGAELGKLSVPEAWGFAISPDAKCIAMVVNKRRSDELNFEIRAVPSGQLLFSAVHGKNPKGPHASLFAGFNAMEFTSDGKYLITSGGLTVKVWNLGGSSRNG